jgi:hypothetical protein
LHLQPRVSDEPAGIIGQLQIGFVRVTPVGEGLEAAGAPLRAYAKPKAKPTATLIMTTTRNSKALNGSDFAFIR